MGMIWRLPPLGLLPIPITPTGSCTPTLRLIPPIQKSDTMTPSDTLMRGRCDDSVPYLRPTGDCGTPVAPRHAALRMAKPRRGVTAATGAISAPAVVALAVQRAHTLCGAHPTTALRYVRTRASPSRANPYLHPTVTIESSPRICCPPKVSPVREAEVFPHVTNRVIISFTPVRMLADCVGVSKC
jgi:hypothetical protein